MIFSHALRFTQAKEVMLVINRLTMTNAFGSARAQVVKVSSRMEKQQYIAEMPVTS